MSEMKKESGNGWLLAVFLFDYELAVWLGQIASLLSISFPSLNQKEWEGNGGLVLVC